MDGTNRFYEELPQWWPLFSRPDDYREEADYAWHVLERAAPGPVRTLLELGSGGGNNASHLKTRCALTLSDLSSGMVEVSQRLNSECEHHVGDMRTLRLGRTFDAVMVHDAISYMTTPADLQAALATGRSRPGGPRPSRPRPLSPRDLARPRRPGGIFARRGREGPLGPNGVRRHPRPGRAIIVLPPVWGYRIAPPPAREKEPPWLSGTS